MIVKIRDIVFWIFLIYRLKSQLKLIFATNIYYSTKCKTIEYEECKDIEDIDQDCEPIVFKEWVKSWQSIINFLKILELNFPIQKFSI